jgi:NAD(P)-dependent dehydrogenase (short-subunit alcohol dehydrogenase family)
MKPHSLVVGGTRGLGREVAHAFKNAGHAVSVIGRREPPQSDRQKDLHHWLVDVVDFPSLKKTLDQIIEQNGKLANLVLLQRFKAEGDKWKGEIETSLTATKEIIEALAGQFTASRENSIVVVSSIADEFISDTQPVGYHVAKAGLGHLVRYYAVTLGSKGIRVNCVSPCTMIKEENKDFYAKSEGLQNLFNKIIPLGRMGTAEDSAKVISFLCSDQASFVTGQTITVDGGVSLLSQEALARKITGL